MKDQLDEIRQRLEAANYATMKVKAVDGQVFDISSEVLTDIDRLLKVVERMREELEKTYPNMPIEIMGSHDACLADCEAILKGEG